MSATADCVMELAWTLDSKAALSPALLRIMTNATVHSRFTSRPFRLSRALVAGVTICRYRRYTVLATFISS